MQVRGRKFGFALKTFEAFHEETKLESNTEEIGNLTFSKFIIPLE